MDIDSAFGYWAIADETIFPPGFFDIGDKTFTWVYEHKKEFVEFIILVSNPTGLFLSFQKYCVQRMGISGQLK
jgi:hypothetical protein